ncbi:MAG: DJ-1/PfpI family protein [Candidatus Aminicenantes bacterium]
MNTMRQITTVLILFVLVAIICSASSVVGKGKNQENGKMSSKEINLLLLVARNYGLNYFLNKDIFEQYGWNLILAGALDSIPACPPVAEQVGVEPVVPDVLVSDIKDVKDYDAVIVMPAAGSYNPVPNPFGDLLKDPTVLKLIASAEKEGLAISAACAGVRVLAAAGVIQRKKVVGSPRFRKEYEEAGAVFLGKDHPPAIEGHVITGARGLYYGYANCQAVATSIEANQPRGPHRDKLKNPQILPQKLDWTDDDVMWCRTFGSEQADGGRAICETADGGFVITGYTFSSGTGTADILVMKVNQKGELLWASSFGGAGTEYGYGCKAVDDGYVVAGYTTSFGEGSRDVYLLKLDLYGNEVWSKFFGGSSWDVGLAVDGNSKNGYCVCGYTHSFGAGEEDVYVIKTDPDGETIWSKTFGGERYEFGNSVSCTSDGGCFVGATTGTYGKGNADFYLIRIDADGNKIWERAYGNKGRRGYGFDWCHSMSPTDEGGSICVGCTDCQDIMDAHVVKFDDKGNEVWARSFGNKPFYDYGHSVCDTGDGGYIVCGVTKSIQDDNDISLTRLDRKGKVQWIKTLGADDSDWGSAILATEDGQCVLTGHTDSSGQGRSDVVLIKVRIRID